MQVSRDKLRLQQVLRSRPAGGLLGSMRGTVREIGDVVGPSWHDGPTDAELGIAYRGENGEPVYYTGNGCETTDDLEPNAQ